MLVYCMLFHYCILCFDCCLFTFWNLLFCQSWFVFFSCMFLRWQGMDDCCIKLMSSVKRPCITTSLKEIIMWLTYQTKEWYHSIISIFCSDGLMSYNYCLYVNRFSKFLGSLTYTGRCETMLNLCRLMPVVV